jgi:rhodanese-related sulfurtransferase
MPTPTFRDEVRRLLTQGAQLVDVLPAQEYHDLHLPGAIGIPLKELTEETTARLRKDQPVIVYCSDYQ